MFKNETEELAEYIYNILNNLFLDVDEYCSDPELRDDDDLNDEELMIRAEDALKKLQAL